MSYSYMSFKTVIDKIGKNEIYLPAIQRKFVWDHEQIASFFDSIMRDYPIGTFLFWFIEGEKKNDYTFYKFLTNYHERDRFLNEIAPKPELKDRIIGVLDGQQRLSSIYIAMQGSYAYKKPYMARIYDSAYPKREFYLNLLKPIEEKDGEDFIFEFRFLTDNDAKKIDEEHLWFKVKDVLNWETDPEVDSYYDQLFEQSELSEEIKNVLKLKEKKDLIKKMLRMLHQRITIQELISYFKITEEDLDSILDIFVRVNSGGTPLSKSDLLFSTIVANWEKGREEIEELIQSINKKGLGFKFDTDFIMRSCLVVTDLPVLFKVNNFKEGNIKIIKYKWQKIKDSIEKTVNLLTEFGFYGDILISQNAVIPIVYYIFNDGVLKNYTKKELRSYLVHALIKQVFGAQGDQVLSRIRDSLRVKTGKSYKLANSKFDFNELIVKEISSRSLKVTEDELGDILEFKKGAYSFMILSLLYPNLKFDQVQFHQDHIHPQAFFTNAKLKSQGIAESKWSKWQEMKDKLPNLQVMEGKENESKNKTAFKIWLNGTDSNGHPNIRDKKKFKQDNFIPDIDLTLENFEEFFTRRKELLESELRKILRIN
jgi:uncharacterized protein with ParB-like and HNH nuclease domain